MIKAEELSKVGVDYEAGLKRFVNNESLYEAVLNAFVSFNFLDRTTPAMEAKDDETLAKIVHEAKGVTGNTGLDELYEKNCQLMNLLRTEGYSREELMEKYDAFAGLYAKVLNGIKLALGK